MNPLESIGRAVLNRMDPEKGHQLAIKALQMGLVPTPGPYSSPRIATSIAGMVLPNPVGLAAGFDKNAEVVGPLSRTGFGFIEVGAATPIGQPGNPKPRLFRLTEDQASINRFGFNNDGALDIARRLASREGHAIVGLNLGANKTSSHKAIDYVKVLEICGSFIDFATINVSSPNTERLRDLQGKKALSKLIEGVMETRAAMDRPIPIFLKIAPDLTPTDLEDIAEVARMARLDAIIATNTTVERPNLISSDGHQSGGLAGQPLFDPSTEILRQIYPLLHGEIPIIGVGGISNADQAYAKIKAGASVIQIYTALVYHGFGLANTIAKDLDQLLEADGYAHISEAVGADHRG